ncbi:MAG: RES family NAD+ phosphorylase, partial [Gammaproteobacteria bacterium]|nr:RES family NAD+ phosphorylase [Gammaproteobacteria bacterium]
MAELFDTIKELRQDVVRNIINVLSSQEIFSDLLENKKEAAFIADKVIQHTHLDNDWKFHYTAAITYPFETNHFMHTRYSDGSFPIWYGSMDGTTTIYETAYHMVQTEMQIKNIQDYNYITRERVIYNVFCEGILI